MALNPTLSSVNLMLDLLDNLFSVFNNFCYSNTYIYKSYLESGLKFKILLNKLMYGTELRRERT